MAAQLAESERGCCSVIICQAFYGCRKPKSQWLHYLERIGDVLIFASTVVTESLFLARFLGGVLGDVVLQDNVNDSNCNEDSNSSDSNSGTGGVTVCFTGFSYGGAASTVAVTVFAEYAATLRRQAVKRVARRLHAQQRYNTAKYHEISDQARAFSNILTAAYCVAL